MAQTYKWSDLIGFVTQSNPRLQMDAAGAIVCDCVSSFIWSRADWRISLKKLPPFFLVPLVQDYVTPYINMPTDFLGLRSATLTYNATEPPSTFPPLMVDRYLSLTSAQGRTTNISYESTTGGLRVYPRPPSGGFGPMDWQVEATYKTNPPKVTVDKLANTVIPWDDQYFHVLSEGLRYFIKPSSQQSDQDLTRFIAMIDNMASEENVNLGDMSLHPEHPLVEEYGWGW